MLFLKYCGGTDCVHMTISMQGTFTEMGTIKFRVWIHLADIMLCCESCICREVTKWVQCISVVFGRIEVSEVSKPPHKHYLVHEAAKSPSPLTSWPGQVRWKDIVGAHQTFHGIHSGVTFGLALKSYVSAQLLNIEYGRLK